MSLLSVRLDIKEINLIFLNDTAKLLVAIIYKEDKGLLCEKFVDNVLNKINTFPFPEFSSELKSVEIASILDADNNCMREIITIISMLCGIQGNGKILLITVDFTLSDDDWRALIPTINDMYDKQRFLLVDATTPLKKLLTYHYFNPFSANKQCPKELFINRIGFRNITNKNFLYGGRQVGKTALLESFKSRTDCLVITVSIYTKRGKEALEDIVRKSCEAFQLSDICISSWKNLCIFLKEVAIREKVLLLIDDSDSFLEDLRVNSFEFDGEDPVQLLKNIECDNFKFIFAGKQKVCRFVQEAQNHYGWLSENNALCLTQFNFSEAEEFLDQLKCFGVSFGPDEEELNKKSLICYYANYSPSLLHLFCHRILENAREYRKYTRSLGQYLITDEVICSIVNSSEFIEQQHSLFWITINLQLEYKYLIYTLADYSLVEDDPKNTYTAAEIKLHADRISAINEMTEKEVEKYLDELVQMSILSKTVDGYSFRYARFRDYLRPERSQDDDDIRYQFIAFEDL